MITYPRKYLPVTVYTEKLIGETVYVLEWEGKIPAAESALTRSERPQPSEITYSLRLSKTRNLETNTGWRWKWTVYIGGWKIYDGKAKAPLDENNLTELNALAVSILKKLSERRDRLGRTKDIGSILKKQALVNPTFS